MTTTLDTRPGGFDVLFRPGNAVSLQFVWPNGSIAGHTMTAFLGTTALTPGISGDTVSLSLNDATSALTTVRTELRLLMDGETVISGWATPTLTTTTSQTTTVSVVSGTATVNVSVVAPGEFQADVDAAVLVETTRATAAEALLVPLTQKGAVDGVATLDSGGKVPAGQLPAVALSTFLGVTTSDAAMTALVAQPGDWTVRTDYEPDRSYMLNGSDPTIVGNWQRMSFGDVISVAGRTGAVTLAEADVTGLVADLAAKAADSAVVHLAGSETAPGDKTWTGRSRFPGLWLLGASNGTGDSAAIQAGIDALYAQGGGRVICGSSNYWIDLMLTFRDGVTVEAASFGGTTFKAIDNFYSVTNPAMARTANFGSLVMSTLDGSNGVAHAGSKGITWDGNKANQSVTSVTYTSGTNLAGGTLVCPSGTAGLPPAPFDCSVLTTGGPRWLHVTSYDATTLTFAATFNGQPVVGTTTVIGSGTDKVLYAGWGLQGYWRDVVVEDNRFTACPADGLWSEWGAGTVDAEPFATATSSSEMESRFTGNKAYNNGRIGIVNRGPHDTNWSNTTIFRNACYGLDQATTSYHSCLHAWGDPQLIGVQCRNGSSFDNSCVMEIGVNASNSTGMVITGDSVVFEGWLLNPRSPAGAAGIRIANSSKGHRIRCRVIDRSSPTSLWTPVDFNADGGASVVEIYLDQLGTVNPANNPSTGTIANTTRFSVYPIGSTTLAGIDGDRVVVAKSATYTMRAKDAVVLATAGAGGFTVTFPSAPVVGRRYTVKKVDSGLGSITVAGSSGTIDGAATATVTQQYQSSDFIFDGTNWWKA